MAIVVVGLIAAAALLGHSRSEGRSRFEIQPHDRVGISVQLLSLDLPELCEVELSLTDPDRRRREEQRLAACVELGLPRWLRLQTMEGACTVTSTGVRRGEGLEVVIDGVASCPPLPGATLIIDWGFFAGQRLDHVSTATVVIAPGIEERTLLSRRHNRVKVHVPGAVPTAAVVAAGLAALVVMGALFLALQRRRRRTATVVSVTAGAEPGPGPTPP